MTLVKGFHPVCMSWDVDTLVWTRSTTRAPDEEHNPGARSLHVTTVCLRLTLCVSLPQSFPGKVPYHEQHGQAFAVDGGQLMKILGLAMKLCSLPHHWK